MLSREKPLVKPMAPGLFSILLNLVYILLVSDLLFCNLYFSIYTPKNTKNIYFTIYLSLPDFTFASDREGIDNSFIALGASCWFFVQVFADLCVVSYWIDTLVLKTEGNSYTTFLHHPLLFKGKPTQAQGVAVTHTLTTPAYFPAGYQSSHYSSLSTLNFRVLFPLVSKSPLVVF